MKNDLWKWVAGVLIGVGTTSIGTQIAWFVAFEKDAVTRHEHQANLQQLDQRVTVADGDLRSELRDLSAEVKGIQTEVRGLMDSLRADLARFEKESTSHRQMLSTKLDMLIQLMNEKHPPGK